MKSKLFNLIFLRKLDNDKVLSIFSDIRQDSNRCDYVFEWWHHPVHEPPYFPEIMTTICQKEK